MLTEADIRAALPALLKYALKLTRRVIDAEDLIQDTLTHAWAKRARYLDRDAPSLSLYCYAQCLCFRDQAHFCQTTRRQRVFACRRQFLIDMPAFLCLIVRDVERELHSIPEGMRRAVMLAAMSTDNYAGMAARLKITLGTFKSRLSRGRQHLRTKFTGSAVG
jgi:RNA polymerase sigma-70 factor (ECF subfamily)